MPNNPSRVIQDKLRTLNELNGKDAAVAEQASGDLSLNLFGQGGSEDVLGSNSIRVLGNGTDSLLQDVSKGLAAEQQASDLLPSVGSGVLSPEFQKFNRANDANRNPTSAVSGGNSATVDPRNNRSYGSNGSTLTRKEHIARILEGNTNASGSPSLGQKAQGTNTTVSNQLADFTSYNCILSLGVLSSASINDPQNTYRKNGADFTIARTGGGGIDNSRVTTAFEQDGNLEYFIDDFTMDSILNPNNKTGMSTATRLSFKVQEPYSLGIFLQSLEIAARKAGFLNYLEAPYLLEISFLGWDDNGNSKPVEYGNRKIPFKLINVQFDVDSGGSVYEVSGIPWNEQSLSDANQRIKDPISVRGATVADALSFGEQSLSAILNSKLREIAEKEDKPATDLYVIRFPKTLSKTATSTRSSDTTDGATVSRETPNNSRVISTEQYLARVNNFFGEKSATANNNIYQTLTGNSISDINGIGQSRMVQSYNEGTDHPFPLSGFTYDRERKIYTRNGIEISPDERLFKFPQGMTIQKIIEELVLISNYSENTLNNIDKEGMINWFRVEVECYVLDIPSVEAVTGIKPKVYVYNVVPYKVHSSVMVPPNKGVPGAESLAKQVSKEYDYIYTGENQDVLRFDIEFNTAFFEALRADRGNYGAGSVDSTSTSATQPDPEEHLGADTSPGDLPTSGNRYKDVDEAGTYTGGGRETSAKKNLAKQFHNLLLNSNVDLITANIEIWGDPYYLPDSGLGNYTAKNSGQKLTLTEDGTLDYQRNEVDILVNFRTPVDYNDQGGMDFQSDTTLVEGFSGFYKVITVETSISGNQFTQNLKLVRRKNQTTEGVNNELVLKNNVQSRTGQVGRAEQVGASPARSTPGANPRGASAALSTPGRPAGATFDNTTSTTVETDDPLSLENTNAGRTFPDRNVDGVVPVTDEQQSRLDQISRFR